MGVSADSVYLTTGSGRVYYTKNEGVSWTLIQNTKILNFAHDIILLNEKMIMSTSEGLYTSIDNGNTWLESNEGINSLQIESIASDGFLLFAGTEQQGIFRSEDGMNWTKVNNGLNDFNSTSIHEIIILNKDVYLGTGGGIYLSSDSGNEWVRMFDPGINKSIQVLDFDNEIFVAGVAGTGIYISIDSTKSFTLAETSGLNIQTSYKSIMVIEDMIFVSTNNGKIFLSKNLGQTWNDRSIKGGEYFTYDFEYVNEKLYAATNNGLLVSQDFGINWAFFNNESMVLTDIVVVNDKVYAATESGFFVTSETRDVWYDVNDGLGEQYLNEITLLGDNLYTGTYASSVWSLPIIEANLPPIILEAEDIIINEDVSFSIPFNILTIDDDNVYPAGFTLNLLTGDNYILDNNMIIPTENFNGNLTIPLSINDGIDNSPTFELSVEIKPINDAPKITGQKNSLTTDHETSVTIQLEDLFVQDVDNNFPADFTMTMKEGSNYSLEKQTVIPKSDFIGELKIPVIVNDGELNSEEFMMAINVTEILGLENDFINGNFSIFPNPISNQLNIDLVGSIEAYQLEIYNMVGKSIYTFQKPITIKNNTIDLSEISSGIYSIKIICKQGVVITKIIKK